MPATSSFTSFEPVPGSFTTADAKRALPEEVDRFPNRSTRPVSRSRTVRLNRFLSCAGAVLKGLAPMPKGSNSTKISLLAARALSPLEGHFIDEECFRHFRSGDEASFVAHRSELMNECERRWFAGLRAEEFISGRGPFGSSAA